MTDISSTLSAIDAATGCQQCEGPLGDSPSDSFCSDICQEAWFAARTVPLVGYLEPKDLPAHYTNAPTCGCCRQAGAHYPIPGLNVADMAIVSEAFDETHAWHQEDWTQVGTVDRVDLRAAGHGVAEYENQWQRIIDGLQSVSFSVTDVNPEVARRLLLGEWAPEVEPDPRQRALEARRNRNTGPQQSRRAPRRIDPRRAR